MRLQCIPGRITIFKDVFFNYMNICYMYIYSGEVDKRYSYLIKCYLFMFFKGVGQGGREGKEEGQKAKFYLCSGSSFWLAVCSCGTAHTGCCEYQDCWLHTRSDPIFQAQHFDLQNLK